MLDSVSAQDELLEKLVSFSQDPYGFVLWNYPWAEAGGELEDYEGPEEWQKTLLINIGLGVMSIQEAIKAAQDHDVQSMPIREARTSGHGIGKSACVCWVIDWAQSTMVDTKGVVTANTENQLKTKTWAEMAKWHRLGLSRELLRMTATARFSIDPEHERTWRIDMVPWSEKNTEAFAGLHNKGKRILVIFDEASAIPDIIWETTEGALTDKNTEIIWVVFGNPTKNTGRFRECFDSGRFAHRWNHIAIDSREVSITNKDQIQEWIDDWGEDHDFVRVRVRGVFPRTDATSFISLEMAKEAAARDLPNRAFGGRILGVDVARYGDNSSVIYFRQGRDGRSYAPRVYQGLGTIQLAQRVFEAYIEYKAVAVIVDEGGVGGGVVDQLLHMGVPVYGVQFGSRPEGHNPRNPGALYLNRRAEIWGGLRDWLPYGCIPEQIRGMQHTLVDELTSPTYTHANEDKIQLESKRDMRRRGIVGVDCADALALTFAFPAFEDADGLFTGLAHSGEEKYEDANPLEALNA